MLINSCKSKISLKFCVVLLQCCLQSIQLTTAATIISLIRKDNLETCNADLEGKFLIENVKCPHSGLFAVKGSCTAYIACISFGGDLMKPLKRIECTSGMEFDLMYIRCRPVQMFGRCLQRHCYPTEAALQNDTFSSTSPDHASQKMDIKQHQDADKSEDDDDVEEISISIQQPHENDTDFINATEGWISTGGNNSLPVTSSSAAPISHFIFTALLQQPCMIYTILKCLKI